MIMVKRLRLVTSGQETPSSTKWALALRSGFTLRGSSGPYQPNNERLVQALVEIPGGVRPGRHIHPGEEVGYVLEGTLVLWVQGRPTVTIKAGDSFFIEAGQPHETANEGPTMAKILATYTVEKGKPLATPLPY